MARESGLRIGSFAGAAIVIEPAFLLLAAYIVGSAMLRGGADALPTALIFVGVIFAAILIHEIGHAAAAAALNIPSKRIVLTFFGGYVQFARQPRKLWQEIAVSAAGPGANLATWALAASLLPLLASAVPTDASGVISALQMLAFVSLILGAFNLLPGFPLDGGHILRSALTYVFPRPTARAIAAVCGLIVAALIGLWALNGGMVWTGFIAILLVLAAWAELQSARYDAAHRSDSSDTISNA
ncbi:MAG: site-2 protease family protein [Hyphomonadaceae bacterium]